MGKSLDEIEKLTWDPAPSMLETPYRMVDLRQGGQKDYGCGERSLDLNGEWEMAEGRDGDTPDTVQWGRAITAEVPCSVHTALYENGVIPDPLSGLQDKEARAYSYKEWWMRKQFAAGQAEGCEKLVFEGVCYRAHVWLNGTFLGSHSGMFGAFSFEVSGLLQEENTLVVKIDNAPDRQSPLSDFMDNDEGWHDGVVINCVYGWHYACLPSRGIWRPVFMKYKDQAVRLEAPLVSCTDSQKGLVDICVKILKGEAAGTVYGQIRLKNAGEGQEEIRSFTQRATLREGEVLHYRVCVPNPRLWWPNGIHENTGCGQNETLCGQSLDEQPVYELWLQFVPDEGRGNEFITTFGMRTIEMGSLPGGPYEDKHNWTYVINGKPFFVKGANWCTLDALLRFPKERYRRFLSLAKAGNIQLLRAWGGGMPETEEFYDYCDRYGIMVMQEWPTCWDSQKQQPFGELEETVLTHMPRLRNHPSLIMWCGGNESKEADGEAMDMMARYAYELDGSRCFHRTSPWGGGLHNYSTYWDMQDIDVSLQLKSHMLGEFGMASVPNIESVMRYLPQNEKQVWPPDRYGSFAHHTPRFNQFDPCDMDYLSRHASEFCTLDTMEDFIWATQIAQATGVRHTLENYRGRWPESTAACYYKLTDVYPAASWASIDYYGVPKQSYYFLADSFAPVHTAVLFQSTRAGNGMCVPVCLFDDAGVLAGKRWEAVVCAYNRDLEPIKKETYSGSLQTGISTKIGDFCLTQEQTDGRLLLITTKLYVREGEELRELDSTFYWLNYHSEQGCLKKLARTELSMKKENGALLITNCGSVSAVGVSVENTACPEEFETEDSMFWLEPGETRKIHVSRTEGCQVRAWNAEACR